MDLAALDAAIEQANRVFSRDYDPGTVTLPTPRRGGATATYAAPAQPYASVDAEGRFAQPHAKLFPFLGRKVWTPQGPGTLIQVFADRCTVLLDLEVSKCARFAPAEIEPVNWEVEP